jgi:hypothetical protein
MVGMLFYRGCLKTMFVVLENLFAATTSEPQVKRWLFRSSFPQLHDGHDGVLKNNKLNRE